jgi:hypothetical protein
VSHTCTQDIFCVTYLCTRHFVSHTYTQGIFCVTCLYTRHVLCHILVPKTYFVPHTCTQGIFCVTCLYTRHVLCHILVHKTCFVSHTCTQDIFVTNTVGKRRSYSWQNCSINTILPYCISLFDLFPAQLFTYRPSTLSNFTLPQRHNVCERLFGKENDMFCPPCL